ncbi:MAG: hypothetical protein ACAH95_12850 [Fimbriimonas sp.]
MRQLHFGRFSPPNATFLGHIPAESVILLMFGGLDAQFRPRILLGFDQTLNIDQLRAGFQHSPDEED